MEPYGDEPEKASRGAAGVRVNGVAFCLTLVIVSTVIVKSFQKDKKVGYPNDICNASGRLHSEMRVRS